MDLVNIGSSELRIAPLAFGGNVFGWTVDEKRSFELLDAFVDRGFNCVDTADVYMRYEEGFKGGESETVIGNWLAQGGGRREKLVLCTKVGHEMAPGEGGLSAAYIERAVEASLRRLQTDHIDLYISHRDDTDVPLEETLGAYDRLIKAGKVRAIGASNFGAERFAEALDVSERNGLARYVSLQTLYNLHDRAAYEGPLEELCRERDVAVFPFFALASGFLTGKYRSEADFGDRLRAGYARRYLDERGKRILAAMDQVAEERGITLAQIAIAWLLSKPTVTAPVASATSLSQLEPMLAAVEMRLTEDELARLDAASAVG